MSTPWWGTYNAPSAKLAIEILALKQIFSQTSKVAFNPLKDWDNVFSIITEDLQLVFDANQGVYWNVSFAMIDITSQHERTVQDCNLKLVYPDNWGLWSNAEIYCVISKPPLSGSPHIHSEHKYGGTRIDLITDIQSHNQLGLAAIYALASVYWLRHWMYWKKNNIWPN